MRLFTSFIFLLISFTASAQSINEQIANPAGINLPSIYQQAESVRQQQLQNEMLAQQLQQMRQQQQSVGRNSENERLQRELLELQIQQKRLKLEKLKSNESMDRYVALTDEQVVGESKICLYSYDSALYDFTVSSADKCPQSIKVRK